MKRQSTEHNEVVEAFFRAIEELADWPTTGNIEMFPFPAGGEAENKKVAEFLLKWAYRNCQLSDSPDFDKIRKERDLAVVESRYHDRVLRVLMPAIKAVESEAQLAACIAADESYTPRRSALRAQSTLARIDRVVQKEFRTHQDLCHAADLALVWRSELIWAQKEFRRKQWGLVARGTIDAVRYFGVAPKEMWRQVDDPHFLTTLNNLCFPALG